MLKPLLFGASPSRGSIPHLDPTLLSPADARRKRSASDASFSSRPSSTSSLSSVASSTVDHFDKLEEGIKAGLSTDELLKLTQDVRSSHQRSTQRRKTNVADTKHRLRETEGDLEEAAQDLEKTRDQHAQTQAALLENQQRADHNYHVAIEATNRAGIAEGKLANKLGHDRDSQPLGTQLLKTRLSDADLQALRDKYAADHARQAVALLSEPPSSPSPSNLRHSTPQSSEQE